MGPAPLLLLLIMMMMMKMKVVVIVVVVWDIELVSCPRGKQRGEPVQLVDGHAAASRRKHAPPTDRFLVSADRDRRAALICQSAGPVPSETDYPAPIAVRATHSMSVAVMWHYAAVWGAEWVV